MKSSEKALASSPEDVSANISITVLRFSKSALSSPHVVCPGLSCISDRSTYALLPEEQHYMVVNRNGK